MAVRAFGKEYANKPKTISVSDRTQKLIEKNERADTRKVEAVSESVASRYGDPNEV